MKIARLLFALLIVRPVTADQPATNSYTIAAYNLENWLEMERHSVTNAPKPEAERNAVAKVLAGIRPDVLGVAEIGTTNDLADLQARLRDHGLDFPHFEWVQGADLNRRVALLSRFPITERLSHTNDTYVLNGQNRRIERGILDVRVQVNPQYSFRALVVHLKSKRAVDYGDQAAIRLAEAKLLHQQIETILHRDPHENFIILGDFNDTPDSPPLRELAGTNCHSLFILAPRDSKGFDSTHFWRWQKDPSNRWSRIDYLMASPGMSNEYVDGSAMINDPPGWRDASDHRAISARFYTGDRGTNLPARVTGQQ
jgi:endonuclease/exonuclease/phosphatase family metal-dependent hydrolase